MQVDRVLPPVPPSRRSQGPPPRISQGPMGVMPPPGMQGLPALPPPRPASQLQLVVPQQPMPQVYAPLPLPAMNEPLPMPPPFAVMPPPPPPGILEPPPGLTAKPGRRTLVLQQEGTLATYTVDTDKWDNQSVSSFTSTGTSKSQGHRCRCEKCKLERRVSRNSTGPHKQGGHRRHRHHHKRKSVVVRVTRAVLFPVASCIAT
jgi:hypothetical protein